MKFKERPLLADEFILLDGVTRAGKFMLANVVAALDRVEFFQYPHLLETVLYFHRLEKIDFFTARELLHLDYNMNTLNMAFGRSLNSRKHDLSCIENSIEFDRYKKRSLTEDREFLLNDFRSEKRIPFYINHEGLSNMQTIFKIFPKVKIVNALRDPIALVESWYRRGWGRRIGSDPSVGWSSFDYKGNAVPWWAVSWPEEYLKAEDMDRCLKSIYTLVTMAKESYLSSPQEYKSRVLFVEFEKIIVDPMQQIKRLEVFLGSKTLPGIEEILKRERLPRKEDEEKKEKIYSTVRSKIAPNNQFIFDELATDYGAFWGKL
ncbi:MAG: sulfotransferase domain-containing protein [Oligoflexia bacterium]|nr:sulfotransferase domain-containing protein [Oligoflexia bacterium]